jgi:acetyltransferase-like isoleucine patch superfamily enzyme
MNEFAPGQSGGSATAFWRVAWTVVSFGLVETIVCGLSAMPTLALWLRLIGLAGTNRTLQIVLFASGVVPSYMLFAITLMVVSPIVTRLLGWRTPKDAEMRIAELSWPLLRWVRYVASNHVVRVLAGTIFRGSPLWTAHLRLSGAQIGSRVFVNSLGLNDYNLLEFSDDVTIGSNVHLSGHTVEAGIIKTGSVRLGRNTTVGVGSVIEIGVECGADCTIGALAFVPKQMKLDGDALYTGIPAKRIG